jgi:hypothetical protein
MNEIDFLPVEYRQKHAQRQSQPWQAVASVAIISLVAIAALTQNHRRRALEDELTIITPAYEAAMKQQARLADVQARLKAAGAAADLYTYLHHPWPRTQLLTALVTPLPEGITLQQVQVLREAGRAAVVATAPATAAPPIDKKAEEESSKLQPPAERDLAKLGGRLDSMHTVVILTGTATDSAILHSYIGALDATDIFDKAELDCFNSIDNSKGNAALQFRAVLSVQPGYGQPGSPTRPDKRHLAMTHAQKP